MIICVTHTVKKMTRICLLMCILCESVLLCSAFEYVPLNSLTISALFKNNNDHVQPEPKPPVRQHQYSQPDSDGSQQGHHGKEFKKELWWMDLQAKKVRNYQISINVPIIGFEISFFFRLIESKRRKKNCIQIRQLCQL